MSSSSSSSSSVSNFIDLVPSDDSGNESERSYDSDAPEAKQEAPQVGQKRKGRKTAKNADKGETSDMMRWTWTYNKPDGLPYGLYPAKNEKYVVMIRTRGKTPDPLPVTFTVYQEEVAPTTGQRHIQGYTEFGKALTKQDCDR